MMLSLLCRMRRSALALPLMTCLLAPVSLAQPDAATAKGGPNAAALAKAAEKPSPYPKFDEVTKDLKPSEGLFTLYRADTSDKDADPEVLMARIPRNLLDTDLLFATSISRGGYFTSWMWNDYLVQFRKSGEYVLLVTPDVRYVSDNSNPVSDVVKRTYNEQILAAVKIKTMAGADPVIDLNDLLKSDIAGVAFMAGRGKALRRELSTWEKVKAFPDNVLIDVNLAMKGQEEGSYLGVSYAFRRLPKLGSYSPRKADPRVGYFLTARQDWTKKPGERELFDRYINRWQLEKRDPSLELSPPKKPIVFVIEKTVPIQWRRWVRKGIEDWNQAFEKIGYTDAIIVQQQTDDNEFSSYDPEDARYNFFRWIVSGTAFARGPSRVDPRTGEILDADIIMDDSFVRVFMQRFDIYSPGKIAAMKSPEFEALVQAYPDLFPALQDSPFQKLMGKDDQDLPISDELLREALHRLGHDGQHVCTHAYGMQHQLSMLQAALLATGTGKKLPERFIGEAICEVVTHEVGHTLGLRHNFKGSNWLSLDEVRRRRDNTDEPTVASVMDYNPLLFFKGDMPDTVRHFITPCIGPYDEFAIEYGYKDLKGKEDEELAKIAARGTETALNYATDEDTMSIFSPDPTSNRYDMGSDPLGWAKVRMELCDDLSKNLTEWSVNTGEPLYYATSAFNALWFERLRNFEYVARIIGGQYVNRDFKGDPNQRPPFQLVSADTQRSAMKLLGETILSDSFFTFDPATLNALAPQRWSHWGMSDAMRVDYPIHERVAAAQSYVLSDILNPITLQRIYDAELKAPADERFPVAEVLTGTRDMVWGDLAKLPNGSDQKPAISSIRRTLQREYLDMMVGMAQSRPGALMSADLHAMVRQALRELSEQIGRVSAERRDFATKAHLNECKSRIDRVLDAQFIAR